MISKKRKGTKITIYTNITEIDWGKKRKVADMLTELLTSSQAQEVLYILDDFDLDEESEIIGQVSGFTLKV